MSDWQRSRVLASGAAALLAMGLAFSSGFAASAAPSAKADNGQGKSDVRNTGPDFNKGKKLPISAKESDCLLYTSPSPRD